MVPISKESKRKRHSCLFIMLFIANLGRISESCDFLYINRVLSRFLFYIRTRDTKGLLLTLRQGDYFPKNDVCMDRTAAFCLRQNKKAHIIYFA
jgi:hypothetical protein